MCLGTPWALSTGPSRPLDPVGLEALEGVGPAATPSSGLRGARGTACQLSHSSGQALERVGLVVTSLRGWGEPDVSHVTDHMVSPEL